MKKELKQAIEKHGFKVYGNLVMIEGNLYPLPLVQGNEKLGKSVWHSSTLPTNKTISAITKGGEIVSEVGTCPCTCEGCYGTTGNYRFNSVILSLIMRTRLLRNYPDIYFLLVDLQITFENVQKLRIHATGDFIKGEATGYINVLKNHQSVKAWSYTKCEIVGEIEDLDHMPNCNIVKSKIFGYGFNFGKVAYIANVYYALKRLGKSVHICECGIDKNKHCSDCSACSENEFVLFIEHSTGYKPEKDYGFTKLVSLIKNQK